MSLNHSIVLSPHVVKARSFTYLIAATIIINAEDCFSVDWCFSSEVC